MNVSAMMPRQTREKIFLFVLNGEMSSSGGTSCLDLTINRASKIAIA